MGQKILLKSLLLIAIYLSVLTSCSYIDGLINISNHDCEYGEWISIYAPTCSEKGLSQRFCSICMDTQTKYTDELGHDEISYSAKEPTCGDEGCEAYVICSRCDYSTYRTISATGNHQYNSEKTCEICFDFLDKGMKFVLCNEDNTYMVSLYEGKETDVIIPSKYQGISVTKIGEKAFADCSNINSITIPSTIKTIEAHAFENCSNLQEVRAESISSWCGISFVPNQATGMDGLGIAQISSNPMHYAERLYIDGQILVDLVIPDDVTVISHFSFYSCESIRTVTFHDGITSVGASAFYKCENIVSLYIDSIESFCNIDFYEYPAMAAYFSVSNPMKYASDIYVNGIMPVNLVIPSGVTYIPQHFFGNCSSIQSVYIPDTVKKIGYGSFANSSHLNSVVFANCVGWEVSAFQSSYEAVSDMSLSDPNCAVFLFKSTYNRHDWIQNNTSP